MTIILETDIEKAKSYKPLPNCITSFNAEGYRQYGKEFLETWREYWSPRIRLTIYYEGEEFGNEIEMERGFSWRPIEEVEFLSDFMDNLRFPIMHGIVGHQYDVWFDARHGRKTFMFAHACKQMGGKVFWVDADSITHSHVPEGFLDECLPDDALSCYLGRDGWYFTESGFLGINMNHPKGGKLIMNLAHTFITGTAFANFIHGRPCWNDCGQFDAIRHAFGNGEEFVNLAEGLPKGTMNPFINSKLGAFMNHKKGARKSGKPFNDDDLVVERKEEYWKQNA